MKFDFDVQDNAILKKEVASLSVRSIHVLAAMGGQWNIERVLALTEKVIFARKNAGKKTVNEIMAFRKRCLLCEKAGMPTAGQGEVQLALSPATPLPQWVLQKLSDRSRKRLVAAFPNVTVGDVCSLSEKVIRAWSGAGRKVVAELMALRVEFVAGKISADSVETQPSAGDFGSLAEMMVALEGSGKEQYRSVMAQFMGLLNVNARRTLEECGRDLGVTRERVRQIAVKIGKQVFRLPRQNALDEVDALVRETFEAADNREVSSGALIAKIESAFGWTGTTAFSLQRLLDYLGWKITELPEGRGWGWNADGRFDWVKTYRPPTLTERRRAAIKTILSDAGFAGLTVDEVRAACSRDYPDLKIGEGNIRGAMNDMLDDEGTHIIPYDRGTRLNGGTRYSLNSFFRDAETRAVLEKAAKRIRAYMEKTGLGVVSVWKASREHQPELPRPLPKLGFYMMMRDFKSGGLVYQDYPRIAYPGVKVGENTFPWMLYMYCMICRRPKVTFAEIMYFFTECLGLQPSIACACSFASMGLKKVDEDVSAPYVVKPPAEGVEPPSLFLPAIRKYLDFSLIKVPEKSSVNPYFLDEDGRALAHGTYAKIFFRALEGKKFDFSAGELAGLQDKGWCKVHFKSYRPVLRRAGLEKRPTVSGYWREKFTFNGEHYFISDDWEPRNKSAFDDWAARMASLAGIAFEPYEVVGLSSSNG